MIPCWVSKNKNKTVFPQFAAPVKFILTYFRHSTVVSCRKAHYDWKAATGTHFVPSTPMHGSHTCNNEYQMVALTLKAQLWLIHSCPMTLKIKMHTSYLLAGAINLRILMVFQRHTNMPSSLCPVLIHVQFCFRKKDMCTNELLLQLFLSKQTVSSLRSIIPPHHTQACANWKTCGRFSFSQLKSITRGRMQSWGYCNAFVICIQLHCMREDIYKSSTLGENSPWIYKYSKCWHLTYITTNAHNDGHGDYVL